MNLNYKFKNKEEKARYILISEYTWGGVHVDVDWALKSPLYKITEQKLIDQGILNGRRSS